MLIQNDIPKTDFQNRIIKNGKICFVLRYHKKKFLRKFEIILPKDSPSIISDYHSKYRVLGGNRSKPTNMVVLIFILKLTLLF